MAQLAITLITPAQGTERLIATIDKATLPAGMPQSFISKLISLYRAGQFPFDRLVKFYDFSDINEAIADAVRGDTIKPVLRIGEAWSGEGGGH